MPITDETLRTMGLIAVAASKLEDITAILARELIDDDPRVGRIAMGGDLGFSRVVTRLVPLSEARNLPTAFTELLAAAVLAGKTAMEERNRLLHSNWMSGTDGEPLQVRSDRKGDRFYLEVTADDISATFMALSVAERAIRKLWVEVAHHFGRAESDATGRVLRLPDRWPDAETKASPSHTWSAEDRWVRGLAEWEEVEEERRRGTGH
jgi:hypothetical protein